MSAQGQSTGGPTGQQPSPQPPESRIDWMQFLYPGPRRVFSDAELALAGGARLNPTLVAGLLFNFGLLALVLLMEAPASATPRLTALFVMMGVLGMAGTRALWRRPTRKRLALWSFGAGLGGAILALLVGERLPDEPGSDLRAWVLLTGLGGLLLLTMGWWFAVIYRAQQVEARLRELAEQQQALDMARQLAAAQIQPHFLFNSLASLQHWVHSKDDRAAPLLDALLGFLRATLPLFNRERLALGDEAEAVRQYLTVTGLRLGDRLRWTLHIAPEVQAEQVPPGLLLTLVENAVEHGVQASLSGADIELRATRQGPLVVVEVLDTGPGPAPGAADGVGLGNSRWRLQQAFGPRARLSLSARPEGGCRARIEWPAPAEATRPDPPRELPAGLPLGLPSGGLPEAPPGTPPAPRPPA